MKVLGWRRLAIEQLGLGGRFRERLNAPSVLERARSVARVGILSEPGVRVLGRGKYRLIYGRDRIAAAICAGETHVLCKLYECSDEEAVELEITENAHRRHDPDGAREQLTRMLDLYEREVVANPVALEGNGKGRHSTPRGIARRRIALQKGVKPDSVRKAERRAYDAKHHREARRKRREAEPQAEIILIGMEVTDDFLRGVNAIREHMTKAHRHVLSAQRDLTLIKELTGSVFPAARLQRLHDEAHMTASLLKSAIPAALCPFCKGLPGLQEECAGCQQSGWITSEQCANVPRELWQEGDKLMVAHRGRIVSVAELLGTAETKPEQFPEVPADTEDLFA